MTQFTCEACGRDFTSTCSDNEAWAVYDAEFPNMDGAVAVVCDDCYRAAMAIQPGDRITFAPELGLQDGVLDKAGIIVPDGKAKT